jgi:hypothetical protein
MMTSPRSDGNRQCQEAWSFEVSTSVAVGLLFCFSAAVNQTFIFFIIGLLLLFDFTLLQLPTLVLIESHVFLVVLLGAWSWEQGSGCCCFFFLAGLLLLARGL